MDISTTCCQGNVREFQSVWRVVNLLANTKVSTRQLCVYEGPCWRNQVKARNIRF